jgi:endo-1,3-1,4-beta-glycanase ExoK
VTSPALKSLPLALLLVAASALSAAAQISAADRSRTGQSFVDRFEHLDRGRWYISNGWTNGAHQNCIWSAQNVKGEQGVQLTLLDKATAERPFTCAEIQSMKFLGYGAYEVRMRAVANPGTVTAFFTYTGPPHGAGVPWDEIDFEILGKTPRGLFLNYFTAGRKHEQPVPLAFDATAQPNTYAFVWLPGSIRWFANGKLVRSVRATADDPVPSRAQKLYLSLWNGTSPGMDAWLGRFTYPGTPLVASYEYVAFTRVDDPCQFPESIVCTHADVFSEQPG